MGGSLTALGGPSGQRGRGDDDGGLVFGLACPAWVTAGHTRAQKVCTTNRPVIPDFPSRSCCLLASEGPAVTPASARPASSALPGPPQAAAGFGVSGAWERGWRLLRTFRNAPGSALCWDTEVLAGAPSGTDPRQPRRRQGFGGFGAADEGRWACSVDVCLSDPTPPAGRTSTAGVGCDELAPGGACRRGRPRVLPRAWHLASRSAPGSVGGGRPGPPCMPFLWPGAGQGQGVPLLTLPALHRCAGPTCPLSCCRRQAGVRRT